MYPMYPGVFFWGANKKDTESLQLQVNNPWKMVVDRLPYCWLKILQHLGCRKPCNNHEVYFTQIRFNGIEPSTCLQNLSAKLGDLVGYLFISVDLLSKNTRKNKITTPPSSAKYKAFPNRLSLKGLQRLNLPTNS